MFDVLRRHFLHFSAILFVQLLQFTAHGFFQIFVAFHRLHPRQAAGAAATAGGYWARKNWV